MAYIFSDKVFQQLEMILLKFHETRKSTSIGFDDDLSNKSIPIGSAETDTDLLKFTLLDDITLIQGGSN